MSAPGKPPLDPSALQLPPFSLDVEALDLGADVKAVGLELLGTESREPVRGKDAALIWAAVFPALAVNEFFVIDFFSHLDRVREFCNLHEIHYREAAERCLVLPQPSETQLEELFQRFEGETFGVRAPEDGWVTLLSQTLWPTEVIRRIRPAVQKFDVYIARPH